MPDCFPLILQLLNKGNQKMQIKYNIQETLCQSVVYYHSVGRSRDAAWACYPGSICPPGCPHVTASVVWTQEGPGSDGDPDPQRSTGCQTDPENPWMCHDLQDCLGQCH